VSDHRLDSVFSVELAERVHALSSLTGRLKPSQRDEDSFGKLVHEFHSLKGAARAVGASKVERLAHAAEGAVLARRGSGQRPTRAWIDALSAVVDALMPLYEGGRGIDVDMLAAALEVPVSAPAKKAVQAPAPAPAPTVEQKKVVERSNDQGSLRVAVSKLDTLLTESGELSVTHQRVAQRLTELRALQRSLEAWNRDWRKSRPLRSRVRRAHHHASTRDIDALLRFAEQVDHELQSILSQTSDLVGSMGQATAQLGAVASAIGQEVMAIRLLPAGTVFLPLERLVRDLARQTGKEAQLVLTGSDTEVDRRILDELRDPLMHMVRNSADHGLESTEDRLANGKSAHGTIRLGAVQRGDRVHITLEDDGRGLDIEAIRATAVRRGLLTQERADAFDVGAATDLIFHSGFTTRAQVSELSGRGVGMDVVRSHVQRLGGDISVRTSPGAGTCFTISVPLTLATTRVLLVEDGGEAYAIPSSAVERTGRIRAADLLRLEGRRAIQLEDRAVPVVELADVLQRKRSSEDVAQDEWRPFFIVPNGDRSIALMTDRLVDEQELVVKGLGAPLKRVRHVGGAAVLGTGAVVVILNPTDLAKTASTTLDRGLAGIRGSERPAPQVEVVRRRVMVVDDSVMTRTLERSILEAAGYEVVVASDGQQALELLQSASVDLIVSDVEMPRLDGLGLTAAVRQDELLRHLPVILVTSLDSPEHVERGAAAGADAYIVKGRFDQAELLSTVGRLL